MVKINGEKTSFKICLLISLFLLACFGNFTVGGQTRQSPSEQKKEEKVSVLFGVVADNTGSMRTILEKVIATTKKIAEAKKLEDAVFLVSSRSQLR